jgi:DNA-binding NtrC family response regulator
MMTKQSKIDTSILIIDDDSSIRNSIHEFIGMAGYKSFETSSAEEALEILKTNTIHVVITDIRLPGMNGLELTDLIKSSYDTDVIVITGYILMKKQSTKVQAILYLSQYALKSFC